MEYDNMSFLNRVDYHKILWGIAALLIVGGCVGAVSCILSDMAQSRQFSPSEAHDSALSDILARQTEGVIPHETQPPITEGDSSAVSGEETTLAESVPDETEPVTEVSTTDAETEPPEPAVHTDAQIGGIFDLLSRLENDYTGTLLEPTEDAGSGYLDRIVFLGDSTTYGLKRYGLLNGGARTRQVWTPASGTLTLAYVKAAKIVYPESGTEITIEEAVKAKKPDILVITLGVNGVSFMKEEHFKSVYTDLVQTIQEASPDTKIILQSMFPVAASYAKQNSINNTKIMTANNWVAQVAQSCGVRYANSVSVLLEDDGFMSEAHQNGDGLHPNKDGYALVLDYLRTHAYPEDAPDVPVPEETDAPESEYTGETEALPGSENETTMEPEG